MAVRSEAEIFSDLERLCGSPGYIHLYAVLVVKNTFVRYTENISDEDFLESFGDDHLIRTELSTLLGLMMKSGVDFTIPNEEELLGFQERTLALLEELHVALSSVRFPSVGDVGNPKPSPFRTGAGLREPIFYTGESAYASQFRDLAPLRYQADEEWIREHCGFTLDQAARVGRSILVEEERRVANLCNSLASGLPENFAFLPAFTFTARVIAELTGESEEVVRSILSALSVDESERNLTFLALNDFNIANAKPMLREAPDSFILFQAYSFYQSLFESPFFWMLKDDAYKDKASDHRGDFTEDISARFLTRVFDAEHIQQNVFIKENSAKTFGEIDVLVLFGNRALVIQTKSKRLTLEARRGNDRALKKDFTDSVADSYQQALECAQHILKRDKKYVDATGKEIAIPALKRVYLLCVVADHYPALSFQAKQFLEPTISKEIPAPFVTDVFTLDVFTEMLNSPLHLLSYIDRRTAYGDRILSGHELNILGYHLGHNLWIPPDVTDIFLHDDVSSSLDAAMAVRRDGVSGSSTPAGILTLNKGSIYDGVLNQIDRAPHGQLVDLGLMLLRMNSESASKFSSGVEYATGSARKSGTLRDVTLGDRQGSGVTIHSSYLPASEGVRTLANHVSVKKYRQKASSWFGIGIHPDTGQVMFGTSAEFEWKQDDRMEKESMAYPSGRKVEFSDGRVRSGKVGRNEQCPCGSGKKYKKCHLNAEGRGQQN